MTTEKNISQSSVNRWTRKHNMFPHRQHMSCLCVHTPSSPPATRTVIWYTNTNFLTPLFIYKYTQFHIEPKLLEQNPLIKSLQTFLYS